MRSSLLVACNLLYVTSLVACAAPTEDEVAAEEDAAAGGKSDAAGFQLGPFTREPSYDGGQEPIIAYFHAPDGSEARGESGQFDLVLHSDDDDVYESGTFKLYTYQGRDRIRLTNRDGQVVLRSDWSYDSGTLTLGDGIELGQPRRLPEELVDCLVVDVVDSGVFEESLSTYEYPSVSVDREGDKTSLEIGGSSYDASDATITVVEDAATFTASAATEYHTITIRVPNQAPRRGEIVEQIEGEDEHLVAAIVCRP